MKYLNKKVSVTNVEVGDEVMFIADIGELTAGTQAVVTIVNGDGVVVEISPKTAYEQENASLRASVSITEAELNVLVFSGDLQEYAPAPKPEAKEEVKTDEKEPTFEERSNSIHGSTLNELPNGPSSEANLGANLQGPAKTE